MPMWTLMAISMRKGIFKTAEEYMAVAAFDSGGCKLEVVRGSTKSHLILLRAMGIGKAPGKEAIA